LSNNDGDAVPSLHSLVEKPEDKVPDYAWTWDYFLTQGVSWDEFRELPLPYIFMMMRTAKIKEKKRERERKKNK